MPTTVNLKPILDKKSWEFCATPPTSAGSAHGTCVVSSSLSDQLCFLFNSATSGYYLPVYDPVNDSYTNTNQPTLTGFGTYGNCTAYHHPFGISGTSSANSFITGSTTTIPIAQPFIRSLAGYKIRITAGTNAGSIATIANNTTGATTTTATGGTISNSTPDRITGVTNSGNFKVGQVVSLLTATGATFTIPTNTKIKAIFYTSTTYTIIFDQNITFASGSSGTSVQLNCTNVVTVTPATAFASAIDSTSQYQLITGTLYTIGNNAGTGTLFNKIDYATGVATSLGVTNLPTLGATTAGAGSALSGTPSFLGSDYVSQATGTATSATNNTLVNSGKTWTTNQWSNYQVRITAGTGIGQIRTISSNDGTSLTVSSNWTVNPDNTSEYAIEGNDDYLYFMTSGSATLYRYSISGSAWIATLQAAPNARGAAGHSSFTFVAKTDDTSWANESDIKNGRFLIIPRGASNIIDYYDIALNGWYSYPSNNTGSAGSTNNFSTTSGYSSCYPLTGNFIYFMTQPASANAQGWKFNIITGEIIPWTILPYPYYSTTYTGCPGKMHFVKYTDGSSTLTYIHLFGYDSWSRFYNARVLDF